MSDLWWVPPVVQGLASPGQKCITYNLNHIALSLITWPCLTSLSKYLNYKLLPIAMMFHTWNQFTIFPPGNFNSAFCQTLQLKCKGLVFQVPINCFTKHCNSDRFLTSQCLVFQLSVLHCRCRSIRHPKLLSPAHATCVNSGVSAEIFPLSWYEWFGVENSTLLPSLTAPLGQLNLAGPVCSPPLYKLTCVAKHSLAKLMVVQLQPCPNY